MQQIVRNQWFSKKIIQINWSLTIWIKTNRYTQHPSNITWQLPTLTKRHTKPKWPHWAHKGKCKFRTTKLFNLFNNKVSPHSRTKEFLEKQRHWFKINLIFQVNSLWNIQIPQKSTRRHKFIKLSNNVRQNLFKEAIKLQDKKHTRWELSAVALMPWVLVTTRQQEYKATA